MSNQPPALTAKLSTNSTKTAASSQASPGASATQQFFTNDLGARRSGSGVSASRQPLARNVQTNRPKHKGTKRSKVLNLDEDVDAERFSMQNPHGRRGQQSITHLMSFALPPRPHQQQFNHRHNFHGPRRGGRVNQTWGLGSGYHAIDKARYIHANYRFIVDPRGEYYAQVQDADVHLDWNNVLQIIASSKSQNASCPICLGDPTAPRMAKCGHMFCLPCLIRYMNSDDGSQTVGNEKKARWKKCPICWDSIYISETRPVRWYAGHECDSPREGSDIVLRLVKRKQGSTLAMPKDSPEVLASGDDVPWHFAAEAMDYSRVLKGSEQYMMEQYDTAIADVERLEREDELMFGEDSEWTSRAIRMLHEAKDKVKGIGNPSMQHVKPDITVNTAPPGSGRMHHGISEQSMTLASHEDEASVEAHLQTTTLSKEMLGSATDQENYVPRTLGEMRDRHFEKPQPSEYLFYHAPLHYYLSPLDIRILKTAFGTYDSFPSSILPRVERVSAGHVVDDELRKRVKYLAHLPYGCEVAFLECDWVDTVPASVLSEFLPLLQKRRKRHDEKEAREEKERIRIEKAEERELAEIRRKRPSIPRDAFSSEALPPLGSESAGDVSSSSQPGTGGMSPPWSHRGTAGFTSLASPSTSPTMSRTVWGTAVIAPSSPEVYASLPHDRAFHEDDGWLQGWEKDLLNEQEQRLATDFEDLELQSPQGKQGPGANKKGKKGKKITLMSTNARRGA